MSIPRHIDGVIEIQITREERAGVEIQLLIAVHEGAVEAVGLHLAGGVEAVTAVENARGRALAILFCVDCKFELVKGFPLILSDGLREVTSSEGVGRIGESKRCDSNESGREDHCLGMRHSGVAQKEGC